MKELKALMEKRNAKVDELNEIKNKAVTEVRAFTEEEDAQFKAVEAEIRSLDGTIEQIKSTRDKLDVPADTRTGDESAEEAEIRALAQYIRWGKAPGLVETREDTNFTPSANGAIIPKTIADRIVKKVYEICPILDKASHYTVKGQLDLPYYDESTSAITVAYADEFSTLAANAGQFKKISLNGFLAGALTKVSRSLMNSSDVDLVSFVVDDMAMKIARWLEKELLIGTASKISGLSTCSQTVTAAAGSAVTMDELIDLQDAIIDFYQANAMWIMNRKTRTAIRKLKDADGRYLLQNDVTSPFGKTLLGKPVYTSDNMPEMAAGKAAIFYGDFSGLAVKFAEEPTIQVLNELYATQHAVGAVGWLEVDAKIQVEQAIAQLKMKAA
ncbi:phage major capsid protein [Raoultibacter timonensis]|uniref:phage major capsid protein n=1 Tax=Raoultibacter timonensis TaxID=1907662 RepID=UPI0026DD9F22|nr:phage major capsid protein [Raoultibacter timonensis]